MKKRNVIGILMIAALLCSCGSKEEDKKLEFPNTTWDMSMEEVREAWKVPEENVKNYDEDTVYAIEGCELFGEETEMINFQFYDMGSDGDLELLMVMATYPEDADMEHVAEEMQKTYGEPDPDVTFYYLYSALDSLKPYETQEPGSVTTWALGSVADQIPAGELDAYREPWGFYQSGLNEENWDQFIHDSRLVRISLLTDKNWNRVEFVATNQWIYETIKDQLDAGQ